ncbi:hypothetical protein [Sporomusa termitida]|uniref:Uncharacterized protein n=1 Tax=Sporomusa termitida TaxID=2377 RepID=A0A517DYE1_9FIRM|nr:hypothetical protein [Sporomusa termitida]QDR82384.1 hypothetical protein SPTER_38100 [Sporomusa termitida]
MNFLRMGARILTRSAPALLLAGGAALVLTLPPVRRGLRMAAVQATKGALIVGDEVKNLTAKLRDKASDIVVEARERGGCPCPGAALTSLRSSAKVKGRQIAVATTAGVLSVQEKAKSVRDDFKDIVDEAKQRRGANQADPEKEITGTEIPHDGLEASMKDIGPASPRKGYSASSKKAPE